jgi:hypothetical protein
VCVQNTGCEGPERDGPVIVARGTHDRRDRSQCPDARGSVVGYGGVSGSREGSTGPKRGGSSIGTSPVSQRSTPRQFFFVRIVRRGKDFAIETSPLAPSG